MKINKGLILSLVAPFMILMAATSFMLRDNDKKIFYLPMGLMGFLIIFEKNARRKFYRKDILEKIKSYKKVK
jgi:hypothetical protein